MCFLKLFPSRLLFRETLKLQRGDSCLQKQTERNQQPSLVKATFKTHTHTHTDNLKKFYLAETNTKKPVTSHQTSSPVN